MEGSSFPCPLQAHRENCREANVDFRLRTGAPEILPASDARFLLCGQVETQRRSPHRVQTDESAILGPAACYRLASECQVRIRECFRSLTQIPGQSPNALTTLGNPFGPKVLPISPERIMKNWSGR